MRSSSSYLIYISTITVILLSLGNLPRLVNGGPIKYHDDQSMVENKNWKDNESIIDDINQPEIAVPQKSRIIMLPMYDFYRYHCGAGRRRDAKGRCRVIFFI